MNNLYFLFIFGFVLASSVLTNDAFAAGYIKFEGLDGEAADEDHKGWSDLVSFSQISTRGDSTSTRTINEVSEISVVKELDKSSPKIAESIAMGKMFPKIEIHFDENDGIYHSYELTNVMISSYSMSGDASNQPIEEISLLYEKLVISSEQIKESVKEPIEKPVEKPKVEEIPALEIVQAKVPNWVQTTVTFWVNGDVSDREFTDGIGYLVREKIIELDEPVESQPSEAPVEPEVPSWIKESTKWWVDGQVPEDQFLESIKWLIKNNIIRGVSN
jgi:type VI secretion system Hcp family effector